MEPLTTYEGFDVDEFVTFADHVDDDFLENIGLIPGPLSWGGSPVPWNERKFIIVGFQPGIYCAGVHCPVVTRTMASTYTKSRMSQSTINLPIKHIVPWVSPARRQAWLVEREALRAQREMALA